MLPKSHVLVGHSAAAHKNEAKRQAASIAEKQRVAERQLRRLTRAVERLYALRLAIPPGPTGLVGVAAADTFLNIVTTGTNRTRRRFDRSILLDRLAPDAADCPPMSVPPSVYGRPVRGHRRPTSRSGRP